MKILPETYSSYSTVVFFVIIPPSYRLESLGLFSSQRGWHQSAISVSLEQLRNTTHTILAHPSSRNIFSPPMVGPGAHKQQHDWLVRQFIIHIDDVLNLAIFCMFQGYPVLDNSNCNTRRSTIPFLTMLVAKITLSSSNHVVLFKKVVIKL